MEISLLSPILVRISSFLYFSSCDNITPELVQKFYQEAKEILKLLKLALDQFSNFEIASDEVLRHLVEGLSNSIDELRDIFEHWQPSSSILHFVLQTESSISKIYLSSRDLFLRLQSLNEHLPIEASSLEQFEQKIKLSQHEQLTTLIKFVLRDQLVGVIPNTKLLVKIADRLSLKTNQQILMETVALEKLKMNVEQFQTTGEAECIDEMLSLVTNMHDNLIMLKKSRSCSSVPLENSSVYNRKVHISSFFHVNNVKSCESMKSENLNEVSHLRCREPSKHGEIIFPHSQDYQQTLREPTLIFGQHLENLKLSHSESLNFLPVLPQNGKKTSFGGLSIACSEDVNEDIVNENLVSVSETDIPAVTSDKKSQIQDIVFSDSNGDPKFIQSTGGVTDLTMNVSEKVKLDPPAIVTGSIPRVEPEVTLRLSVERPQSGTILQQPKEKLLPETVFSSVIEPCSDPGDIEARVQKLVENLKSDSIETLRAAIAELRFLARHSTENRIMIGEFGAISSLVQLLYSTDAIIQEHTVTTLLNLSIHNDFKISICQANAIQPLVHVLCTGSPEAKENSTATLFSLSIIEDNRANIGRSGAIEHLVEMLGNGTLRGKKDAANALFYLSLLLENKVKIVQAGAVKHILDLMDPSIGMVDKAVAVLANLASIAEGRFAIGRDGGIPLLVEAVELGSARGKENAASALLRLCSNSNKFCTLALRAGIIPPLVVLSQYGTPRAKEKARALLKCFRTRVESSIKK